MFENIIKEFKRVKGKGKIVLFGSLSKGTARFDSDIDIAIITDDKSFINKAEQAADNILTDYGRVVSITRLGKDEFLRGKEPIISQIRKGRVLYEGHN